MGHGDGRDIPFTSLARLLRKTSRSRCGWSGSLRAEYARGTRLTLSSSSMALLTRTASSSSAGVRRLGMVGGTVGAEGTGVEKQRGRGRARREGVGGWGKEDKGFREMDGRASHGENRGNDGEEQAITV